MKAKSAKTKGKNFEREIAKALNKAFDTDTARRTPCSGAIEDWPGDICRLPEEISDLVIECKKQETLKIWQFLEQTEREAKHKTGVLIFSRNRSATYCCMKFDDWLNLLLEARRDR